MLRSRILSTLAISLAAAPVLAQSTLPTSYAVKDLGSLPAYPGSYQGVAINASGQAVARHSISYPGRALFYDGTSLVDLGTFGGPTSEVGFNSLNDQGWVIGRAEDRSGFSQPALWENGTITKLKSGCNPKAINSAQAPQITGTMSVKNTAGAFLLQNGKYTALPFDEGDAINNAGQIAGKISNLTQPCFWSASTGVIVMPSLGGGAPAVDSINSSATVAGGLVDSLGNGVAVLWRPLEGNTVEDLGLFNGNDTEAHAINDAGVVVGEFSNASDYVSHAFRWDSANGYVDLETLLSLADQSTWMLEYAEGINQNGQIVGTAYRAGDPNEHAVILSPA